MSSIGLAFNFEVDASAFMTSIRWHWSTWSSINLKNAEHKYNTYRKYKRRNYGWNKLAKRCKNNIWYLIFFKFVYDWVDDRTSKLHHQQRKNITGFPFRFVFWCLLVHSNRVALQQLSFETCKLHYSLATYLLI